MTLTAPAIRLIGVFLNLFTNFLIYLLTYLLTYLRFWLLLIRSDRKITPFALRLLYCCC